MRRCLHLSFLRRSSRHPRPGPRLNISDRNLAPRGDFEDKAAVRDQLTVPTAAFRLG